MSVIGTEAVPGLYVRIDDANFIKPITLVLGDRALSMTIEEAQLVVNVLAGYQRFADFRENAFKAGGGR